MPRGSMPTTESPAPREFKFKAFLSYSHANREWGEWLHKSLETYRVPSSYVVMKNHSGKEIQRTLGRCFRDRDELNSGSDLDGAIREALATSENLVVICSPEAARSKYVN